MEAVFQALEPDEQAACLALNPSPEDLALAAADKAARDKAKEAERRRRKETVVEVGSGGSAGELSDPGEADESDPYTEGGELEERGPQGADAIEREEDQVGVPIAKVSRAAPLPSPWAQRAASS